MSENKCTCPLCNSEAIKPYIECKDFTVSHKTFSIVQCESCGFLFTYPVPNENEIGTYYQSQDYVSHSDSTRGFINRVYHIARTYALQNKAHFIEKISGQKSGSLLDYGCGTGAFLNEMQKRGWKAEGLEPSPEARLFATQRYSLKVSESDVLFSLETNSYDVITLWHVLEHVHRLHETVARLYDLLKENGTIIIAVPNASAFEAQIYGSYWAAYDVPRHLYHFTPTTMRPLLFQHKLKITETKLMPLDSFYVSLLSEKYKKSGFLTGLIRAFIAGLRSNIKAKGNIDFASSILYVVKKVI